MKKLTPETAAAGVAKMALMAFFPGDPDIRAALVSVLMDTVETDEQLDWLVNRALRLYGKWPGVAEIRALYCSRWKPKDGMETYSAIYPEGIPSDRKRSQPERDAPRGGPVTANADFDREIRLVADRKKLQAGRKESDDQETC